MAVKGLGFEVIGAVPDKASLGGFGNCIIGSGFRAYV